MVLAFVHAVPSGSVCGGAMWLDIHRGGTSAMGNTGAAPREGGAFFGQRRQRADNGAYLRHALHRTPRSRSAYHAQSHSTTQRRRIEDNY